VVTEKQGGGRGGNSKRVEDKRGGSWNGGTVGREGPLINRDSVKRKIVTTKVVRMSERAVICRGETGRGWIVQKRTSKKYLRGLIKGGRGLSERGRVKQSGGTKGGGGEKGKGHLRTGSGRSTTVQKQAWTLKSRQIVAYARGARHKAKKKLREGE